MASFLEIVEFVEANDRLLDRNPADMGDFGLAARLSGIVESEEKRNALREHDRLGLLEEPEPPSSIEEVLGSDDLGFRPRAPGWHLGCASRCRLMPTRLRRRHEIVLRDQASSSLRPGRHSASRSLRDSTLNRRWTIGRTGEGGGSRGAIQINGAEIPSAAIQLLCGSAGLRGCHSEGRSRRGEPDSSVYEIHHR